MNRVATIATAVAAAIVIVLGATALTASSGGAVQGVSRSQVSADDSPLVMVLDLSASMDEDDGTGLLKITGAKGAVENVIRSIPATQRFGLWTYPDATNDCSAGGFALTPARISDVNGTIAKVDALIADGGGTPTGPALEGVADALTAKGTTTATLVLVSDGESNCGDSPCIVAQNLIASGFDITVHAVGFRVSQEGREELDCVAAATGGKYVDVDDSDELDNEIQRMTRAQLEVTVAETVGYTGAPARISATIANTSPIVADDVRLLLELDAGLPADFPRFLRLGSLKSGASLTRSWVVGSDQTPLLTKATQPDLAFTVSTWATNADRVSAEGIVGKPASSDRKPRLGDALGDWLRKPLQAGHPLVILGDSFSSGEGASPYETPPAGIAKDCHRSKQTYLMPVLDEGQSVNLACSGARTWDFYLPSNRASTSQRAQLEGLKQAPGAAIMSFGGNDIGFSEIVKKCVLGDCADSSDQVATWVDAADSLRWWLAPLYKDTWRIINTPERRAQRGGEYAPVVVIAYPRLTHASRFGACDVASTGAATFSAREVKTANLLAAHLNGAIKAAVADARAAGFEIYFVPDTADAMQPNHTVCDAQDRYVNRVAIGSSESMHPNSQGYGVMTGAIISWSRTTKLEAPHLDSSEVQRVRNVEPPWRLFTFDTPVVEFSTQATVDGYLFTGAPVRIKGSGFERGTPVLVLIHSRTTPLGTLIADEDGRVDGELRVPFELEVGTHEIVASGTNTDGSYRETPVPVAVLRTPPAWVQVAPFGAGALLLVSAALLTCWWWRRRRSQAVGEGSP